jgi:hypothetical protein
MTPNLNVRKSRHRCTSGGRSGTELGSEHRPLARVGFLELSPPVPARALEPFPVPVRMLDALHLASVQFLKGLQADVTLASYDERQKAVARALGIGTADV